MHHRTSTAGLPVTHKTTYSVLHCCQNNMTVSASGILDLHITLAWLGLEKQCGLGSNN